MSFDPQMWGWGGTTALRPPQAPRVSLPAQTTADCVLEVTPSSGTQRPSCFFPVSLPPCPPPPGAPPPGGRRAVFKTHHTSCQSPRPSHLASSSVKWAWVGGGAVILLPHVERLGREVKTVPGCLGHAWPGETLRKGGLLPSHSRCFVSERTSSRPVWASGHSTGYHLVPPPGWWP